MMFRPRLFLDTSVLFAGIGSAEGGARMLLKLGEVEVVQLLVSSQVLSEIEGVIRRKTPQHLPILAVLLDRSRVEVVEVGTPLLLERCQALVPQPGDARILADAWGCQADYLVTLDRAHFLDIAALAGVLPFPFGTPGDCLSWYRKRLV